MQGLGGWAYPACLALMIVCAIVPVPAELPAMVNGAVLGFAGGSLVTWSGAMIGALISYAAADWLQGRFGVRILSSTARGRLAALGRETGAGELLLLRLTPIVAFHLLNYASGLARVPLPRFLLTTALGILPGAFAFTAAGMTVSHWLHNPWIQWGALTLALGSVAWRVRRRRSDTPTTG